MCVVSMIMDHYDDKWRPYIQPPYVWPKPTQPGPYGPYQPQPLISPEEVAEFRRLLERAREYDRKNHEPDCEMEEKKNKVRELAAQLGVDVSFIDEMSK